MRALLAVPLLLMASEAHACSCYPMTREQTLAKSDLVATGTIEKVSLPAKGDFVVPLVAQFHISERTKGDSPDTITVMTAGQSAACGIELRAGATLELALKKTDDGVYHAASCSQLGLKAPR